MSWPAAITAGQPFLVETSWANAGVAPCYCGGFWAFTLKDEKGGIAAVLVDEGFDVRHLKVGTPGQAPAEKLNSRFTAAFQHVGPLGTHSPPIEGGRYSLFESGQRALDGTPQIALPMAGNDGQRRYRVGTIEVAEPSEMKCGSPEQPRSTIGTFSPRVIKIRQISLARLQRVPLIQPMPGQRRASRSPHYATPAGPPLESRPPGY